MPKKWLYELPKNTQAKIIDEIMLFNPNYSIDEINEIMHQKIIDIMFLGNNEHLTNITNILTKWI